MASVTHVRAVGDQAPGQTTMPVCNADGPEWLTLTQAMPLFPIPIQKRTTLYNYIHVGIKAGRGKNRKRVRLRAIRQGMILLTTQAWIDQFIAEQSPPHTEMVDAATLAMRSRVAKYGATPLHDRAMRVLRAKGWIE
jgi:hypothetical protein